MTDNLKVNVPQSWCYDNATEKCAQYGRLYTFEAAAQACPLPGEGWRLPTADEWAQLVVLYGHGAKDTLAMRKAAYKSLLYPGVVANSRMPDMAGQ